MASTFYAQKAPRAPRNSRTGGGIAIQIDGTDLTKLGGQLRRAAPASWKACQVRLRAVGEVIAEDARGRAAFSTRIPGSIRVRSRGASVSVIAGGPAAPDAAPYENKGVQGKFRHPLFGDREHWYDQTARPFLAPALEAHRDKAAIEILDAVHEAIGRTIGAH